MFSVSIETSIEFYPALTCTCWIVLMTAVWALGPSGDLKNVPINPCIRSGPIISFQIGIYLCTLMQTCKYVLLCQASSGLVLDGVANNIFSRNCLPLWIRQIAVRIPFLHLCLLTVDTNSLGLGRFGIFAPLRKADPRLSCNFFGSFDSGSLHSFLTSYRSLENFFVLSSIFCACSSFFEWLSPLILCAWFPCPNKFESSQPLSHLQWRRNDKRFVLFCPWWVYWLPVLDLSEPSSWSFCWVEHSSDWSSA